MQPVTAIALSGGIDSLVAAALLKDQGHDVIALHFLTGYERDSHCTAASFESVKQHALGKLQPLADQLDIPLYIIDLRTEFKSLVVNYFVKTYALGKTPNPCLVCNPFIKFDILLRKAALEDNTNIATGHYARITVDGLGRRRLLRGTDPVKDQSYFLARLTQGQLQKIVLPLGHMTKEETRRIACIKNLQPAFSEESQDVCFIKGISYSDFLQAQPGFPIQSGPIEKVGGDLVGFHQGLHRYTIGQRRGINCPAAEPYYVVRIEPRRHCLVVGRKQDLLSPGCHVTEINWINPPPAGPMNITVRLRYRHKAVAATLDPGPDSSSADIMFETPEPAVTPGQGAVFYQNDEVLGGGWIE